MLFGVLAGTNPSWPTVVGLGPLAGAEGFLEILRGCIGWGLRIFGNSSGHSGLAGGVLGWNPRMFKVLVLDVVLQGGGIKCDYSILSTFPDV